MKWYTFIFLKFYLFYLSFLLLSFIIIIIIIIVFHFNQSLVCPFIPTISAWSLNRVSKSRFGISEGWSEPHRAWPPAHPTWHLPGLLCSNLMPRLSRTLLWVRMSHTQMCCLLPSPCNDKVTCITFFGGDIVLIYYLIVLRDAKFWVCGMRWEVIDTERATKALWLLSSRKLFLEWDRSQVIRERVFSVILFCPVMLSQWGLLPHISSISPGQEHSTSLLQMINYILKENLQANF